MTKQNWMEIDGSAGEGGGQILRSSLTLSLLTGQPLRIVNIRIKRKKTGLLRQHLVAVDAARDIGLAEVYGNELGSTQMEFIPTCINGAQNYLYRIGSAGSTTLVLQTILPVLALAKTPSVVRLFGGTDNPMAPPFDHLQATFLPLLNRMGPNVTTELVQHGFYPAGGGEIIVRINPCTAFLPLSLLQRNKSTENSATVRTANLPDHIAQREIQTIARLSGWSKNQFYLDQVKSPGPGNVVFLTANSQSITETFTAFGQVGIRAEDVANKAWKQFERYIHFDAPVGIYTADQLLLIMAIAAWQGNSGSVFRTLPLSEHSLSHLMLIERFLGLKPRINEEPNGVVQIEF